MVFAICLTRSQIDERAAGTRRAIVRMVCLGTIGNRAGSKFTYARPLVMLHCRWAGFPEKVGRRPDRREMQSQCKSQAGRQQKTE
jgi:hypothetical protein